MTFVLYKKFLSHTEIQLYYYNNVDFTLLSLLTFLVNILQINKLGVYIK